jgi:hypothetical protein
MTLNSVSASCQTEYVLEKLHKKLCNPKFFKLIAKNQISMTSTGRHCVIPITFSSMREFNVCVTHLSVKIFI